MSFELDAGVFRALSREEAPLANALADSIKPTFSHWDEDYPTLELFEQDAAADELFGYFIDNKLVSIIVATTAPEEFEDMLGVHGRLLSGQFAPGTPSMSSNSSGAVVATIIETSLLSMK